MLEDLKNPFMLCIMFKVIVKMKEPKILFYILLEKKKKNGREIHNFSLFKQGLHALNSFFLIQNGMHNALFILYIPSRRRGNCVGRWIRELQY